MNLTLFSAQPYDHIFFTPAAEKAGITIRYEEMPLNEITAALVTETQAVSVFVNDQVNEKVCAQLAAAGVRIIALRCAGFNNVNLEAARKYQLRVYRVPSYSPESVAEHAVAMILTLNRKTHKAYNRVREQNPTAEIEIEVDTLDQLAEVISLKPDCVLLDNMSPELCAKAVALVAGAFKLEASGGISLTNARAYAETGVDYLAIGALTHSAPVLDIGLDLRAE